MDYSDLDANISLAQQISVHAEYGEEEDEPFLRQRVAAGGYVVR